MRICRIGEINERSLSNFHHSTCVCSALISTGQLTGIFSQNPEVWQIKICFYLCRNSHCEKSRPWYHISFNKESLSIAFNLNIMYRWHNLLKCIPEEDKKLSYLTNVMIAEDVNSHIAIGRIEYSVARPYIVKSCKVHHVTCILHPSSKVMADFFQTPPFCTGCLNAVSVIFFKSSLNISVNFLVKFDWFK